MTDEQVIVIVYPEKSICSACGGGASPDDTSHTRAFAWGALGRSCGKTFTGIATSLGGERGKRWREQRPDLPYVGVGSVTTKEGGFSLVVSPDKAFEPNWYDFV